MAESFPNYRNYSFRLSEIKLDLFFGISEFARWGLGWAENSAPRQRKLAMSDKLSVQLWGMSANAEGQLAIAAIVVIVLIFAIAAMIARRRI
jgi:hypothetical protein